MFRQTGHATATQTHPTDLHRLLRLGLDDKGDVVADNRLAVGPVDFQRVVRLGVAADPTPSQDQVAFRLLVILPKLRLHRRDGKKSTLQWLATKCCGGGAEQSRSHGQPAPHLGLKVGQVILFQPEPAALPGLPPPALLLQPAALLVALRPLDGLVCTRS